VSEAGPPSGPPSGRSSGPPSVPPSRISVPPGTNPLGAPSSERVSIPPPSGLFPAFARPPEPAFIERQLRRATALVDDLGMTALLSVRTARVLFTRPLELRAIVYQMETVGVASIGIASITATFIGMVMAIQFAFGLQKFGGMEYVGRVVGLSFARELAPTLTAIIVGGRVGAGMAAEVGSMNVTEQVDAIRALGADPAKKLVLPRVIATILVMPVLSFFALALGFIGAMIVTSVQFNLSAEFFFRSALETVNLRDLWAGMGKTPFFGFIISIIGCHFGLKTTGGTEGVGRSTTSTVVAISITILIADFFLTKLFMSVF
jgi:phospholipid/cholesterol/gamma-HCH transport system permease protein